MRSSSVFVHIGLVFGAKAEIKLRQQPQSTAESATLWWIIKFIRWSVLLSTVSCKSILCSSNKCFFRLVVAPLAWTLYLPLSGLVHSWHLKFVFFGDNWKNSLYLLGLGMMKEKNWDFSDQTVKRKKARNNGRFVRTYVRKRSESIRNYVTKA